MKQLSMIALLLAGCATTSETVAAKDSTASGPVDYSGTWMPMLFVPSPLAPEFAIDRARGRLQAAGFETDMAPLLGEDPSRDELLLSDDRREPGRCFGTTEVIAVNAKRLERDTMLYFACVTASWKEPSKGGRGCEHTHTLGCPLRGDRALAIMAVDSLSSL